VATGGVTLAAGSVPPDAGVAAPLAGVTVPAAGEASAALNFPLISSNCRCSVSNPNSV
jgi:hypothetical protein